MAAKKYFGVDLKTLDAGQAKAIANTTLIEGGVVGDWWKRQNAVFTTTVVDQIRVGMRNGDSSATIAQRLQAQVFPKSRAQANALVATGINAVSNKARVDSYEENSDVLKGYQQISTLDNKTSDICISYSGMAWDFDGNPLPGTNPPTTLPFNGGPPRHFNCRSSLIPVSKSAEELGLPPRTIAPGTRASMDGQVPDDITFDAFLKSKPAAFQDQLLGKSRAKLWRDGRIGLTQLVDQTGRPKSVQQLVEDANAARKATLPQSAAEKEFTTMTDWFKTFDDPDVTSDEIMMRASPEQRRQIALYEKKIREGKTTAELYKDPETGVWAPERVKIQEKILQDHFTPEAVKKATPAAGEKPVVTVLGGRGGSGKTFLTEGTGAPVDLERNIVINSDLIKEMFPEYEGWNAAHLHEESSMLMKKIEAYAREKKLNVVLDMTMSDGAKVAKQLDAFEASDFRVQGFYMHLPRQEAAFRAIGRATKADKPRYVPLQIILDSRANEIAFQQMIPRFEKWGAWDNQVARGADPRLLGGANLKVVAGKPVTAPLKPVDIPLPKNSRTVVPRFKSAKIGEQWVRENLCAEVNFPAGTTGEAIRVMAQVQFDMMERFGMNRPKYIGSIKKEPSGRYRLGGRFLAAVGMAHDYLFITPRSMKMAGMGADYSKSMSYWKQNAETVAANRKLANDILTDAKAFGQEDLAKSAEHVLANDDLPYVATIKTRFGTPEYTSLNKDYVQAYNIYRHEAGHMIHGSYKAEVDAVIARINTNESGTVNHSKIKHYWKRMVSEYAVKNDREFFAESFVKYTLGEFERVHPEFLKFFRKVDKGGDFGYPPEAYDPEILAMIEKENAK